MEFLSLNNSLRDRFNPEGSALRKYQLYLLNMLRDIASICDDHSIEYCIAYGTCLGAARHGGFIPWDDDIDIHIKITDYKRLRDAINRDQRFIFQDNKSDKGYVFPFAKIRMASEEIILNENGDWDIDYRYKTPYIDVFPFEDYNLPIPIKTLSFRLYAIPQKFNKIRNKIIRKILKKVSYITIHSSVLPLLKFIFSQKGELISCSPGIEPNSFNRNEIFPFSTIVFEGYVFKCPKNIDYYLRTLYGNYRQLPSADEIHVHLDSNCLDYFS